MRISPDKVSRDSGVVSPSDAGSLITETNDVNEFPPKAPHPAGKPDPAGGLLPVHTPAGQQGFEPDPHIRLQPPPFPGSGPYPSRLSGPPPVKAELVTNELDDVGFHGGEVKPPPYHIAAARSKHAGDFSQISRNQTSANTEDDPFYENQVSKIYF